jgi:uncharacterized protein (TIGR02594 family)
LNRDQLKQYLKTGGSGMDPATTAWCAAFVNSALARQGIAGSGSNVATDHLNWGEAVEDQIRKGDVLVQPNGRRAGQTGGHVGFATGRISPDGRKVEMISGNKSNKIRRTWEDINSVVARRATPQMLADAQARKGGQQQSDQQPQAMPSGETTEGRTTWFNPGGAGHRYVDPRTGAVWDDAQARSRGEGPNASGLPPDTPGIALPHGRGKGLGEWHLVTLPDGRQVYARQTDRGPRGVARRPHLAIRSSRYAAGPQHRDSNWPEPTARRAAR